MITNKGKKLQGLPVNTGMPPFLAEVKATHTQLMYISPIKSYFTLD